MGYLALNGLERRNLARLFVLRRIPYASVNYRQLLARLSADLELAKRVFPGFELSALHSGKPVGFSSMLNKLLSERMLDSNAELTTYSRTAQAALFEQACAENGRLRAVLEALPMEGRGILDALANE